MDGVGNNRHINFCQGEMHIFNATKTQVAHKEQQARRGRKEKAVNNNSKMLLCSKVTTVSVVNGSTLGGGGDQCKCRCRILGKIRWLPLSLFVQLCRSSHEDRIQLPKQEGCIYSNAVKMAAYASLSPGPTG